MMEPPPIEPGLLPTFRLFVLLRLAGFPFTVLVRSLWPESVFLGIPGWYDLPGGGVLAAFDLGSTLALFGYLSWTWLRARLGAAFLPLALTVAAVVLIVTNTEAARESSLADPLGLTAIRMSIRLMLQLSILLVLAAWQYHLLGVAVFSLGTALFEAALGRPALPASGPAGLATAGLIAMRLALFALVGYVVARLAAAQQAQRRVLAAANRDLAEFASTLEELATSRERNRLARELHDTLAHSLSAVAVQLEGMQAVWESEPDKSRRMLERSLDLTRQGLVEARRAIRELRASPLEGLGLPLAIRQLAESVAERSRLTLEMNLPDQLEGLRPEVEQGIYRITEEALTNIVQHSGARRLSLDLEKNPSRVELSIRDDGWGFDPGSVDAEAHFGLQGMHERARMIGGTFSVDSRPGAGTTIHLAVEAPG